MPNKPLFSPVFADAVFPFIARLFISAIFVQGALGKILEWSGQAVYMQSHRLPGQLIPTMLGIALVIEAAGVLCLIVARDESSCLPVTFSSEAWPQAFTLNAAITRDICSIRMFSSSEQGPLGLR